LMPDNISHHRNWIISSGTAARNLSTRRFQGIGPGPFFTKNIDQQTTGTLQTRSAL